MTRRTIALLFVTLVSSGCKLGPNYERPVVSVPEAWREVPPAQAASLANTAWWDLYDDPELQKLIRTALEENRDLKIAVERIEEARARYGYTRADLWPKVDVGATGGRLRFNTGSLVHTPEGESAPADGTETDIYSVGASVSWELDFFGRVRRAAESENALFLGTEEARRAAVLALVADVARVYFELRNYDLQLEIARRTIEARREYVQYARDRFEGGVTAEIDYRQAEAELRRVETVVFEMEMMVALRENELSVLLGRNPGPVARGLGARDQKPPVAVPAGLPSELLDRRPDIRVAEQDLAAATANIGAAKALLFPRIALTGSYGTSSNDIDELFEGPSKSWNILGNLLQPIFYAGQNRRRVEITESRQRQLLYAYEQAVLQAFRDTEDALISYRKTGEQRVAQAERVKAEAKVLELAELRYKGGVADYLEVLDAQRSLFDAELDEARTIGGNLTSLVRLYKALGGGWPSAPEPPSGTAAATP